MNFADLTDSAWDVVVIGAGPAGSAAAHCLAAGGMRVLVVEKFRFRRYKVCGCCLNMRALSALSVSGIASNVLDGAQSLDSLQFATSKHRVLLRLPGGSALSRSLLDDRLLNAARNAGAVVVQGVRAEIVSSRPHGVTVSLRTESEAVPFRCKIALVASGLTHSSKGDGSVDKTVRGRIGAGVQFSDDSTEYAKGRIHMAVARGGYVGLVRVEHELLNVAAAFDTDFVRACGDPAQAVAAVLSGCGWSVPHGLLEAPWKGTPRLTQQPKRVASLGRLYIGDAAGYVEPFTGEGMAWALESGIAAARLLLEMPEAPPVALEEAWQVRHRRLFRNARRRCRTIALGLRHPALVQIAAAALSRQPGLAVPILRRLNAPVTGKEAG
jgi:menaquinone-9 beta-reductase